MTSKKLLIFGDTGYIGNHIVRNANLFNYYTIGFSSSKTSLASSHIQVDFSQSDLLFQALLQLYPFDFDSIVFAHRSRPNESLDIATQFLIELNPFLVVNRYLQSHSLAKPIRLFTFSSISSSSLDPRLHYSYPILKSAAQSAALNIGLDAQTPHHVYSNILRFGELINSSLTHHTPAKQKTFQHPNRLLPHLSYPTLDTLTNLLFTFISASQICINRQVLTVDSGINSFSSDYILSTSSNE